MSISDHLPIQIESFVILLFVFASVLPIFCPVFWMHAPFQIQGFQIVSPHSVARLSMALMMSLKHRYFFPFR